MYKKFGKRALDIVLCLIAVPIFALIFIFVAPAIYFADRGPVFYNAERLGRNGKIFKMYKFRSMRMNAPDLRNADGSTFNSEDDPRLTRIGKFIRKTSLDEAPQIFNVLKGDMSIIGPRPDLPEHRRLYEGSEERKLDIRPGVSGYNQAYFRNTAPWKERIKNDIYYIDHLSIWLDVKIFFITAAMVLCRKNVYTAMPNGSDKSGAAAGEGKEKGDDTAGARMQEGGKVRR